MFEYRSRGDIIQLDIAGNEVESTKHSITDCRARTVAARELGHWLLFELAIAWVRLIGD